MKVSEITIKRPYLINIDMKEDIRGLLVKIYSLGEFRNYYLIENVAEILYHVSSLNVMGGMHFQVSPFDQEKLVWIIQRPIFDFVPPILKNSNTYNDCYSFELKENEGESLHISGGIAYGFLSLSENAL